MRSSRSPSRNHNCTLVVDLLRPIDHSSSSFILVDWTIVRGVKLWSPHSVFAGIGDLPNSDNTVHNNVDKPPGLHGWRCWAYYPLWGKIIYAEDAEHIIPVLFPDLHNALRNE